MKKLSPIIVATIRRMVAYVLLALLLGIFANYKKLSGNENYLLDALLALAFVFVAEYRAARAELLLAETLAANQPPSKPQATPVATRTPPTTSPSRPTQAVAPPPPKVSSAPAPPASKIKFPLLSILKYVSLAALLLYLALAVYFSRW